MTTLPSAGWPYVLGSMAVTDLARTVHDLSTAIPYAAGGFLVVLVALAVLSRKRWPRLQGSLFTLIVLITVSATLGLTGLAISLALNSPTGGPVRWGADYQIWACGNRLNIRDSKGLITTRTGSPSLYEHNDRIHFSGTPFTLPDDASLGAFMKAVGGEISDTSLIVPLNDMNISGFDGWPASPEQVEPYIVTDSTGISAHFTHGQKCDDQPAAVQVFAYHLNATAQTYSQTKLLHPASYELSRSSASPPGDCVIIEFAPPKDRTDHLCASYGKRDTERCTQFGIPADKVVQCDLQEQR